MKKKTPVVEAALPPPTVVAAPVAVVLPAEPPPPPPLPTPAPTAATIRQGFDHDRRKRPRTVGGEWLTRARMAGLLLRSTIEVSLGVLFGLTATHGRLIHDNPVTVWDVTLAFLSACTVLGYKGLLLYSMRNPPPTSPASPQPS